MSATMRIVNGQVYDPKNNINGEIKEICIQDGKIVDAVDIIGNNLIHTKGQKY